ncbi:hypothetical protein [Streptomyces sp. NPDC048650]|uniref:hypothetical protein n=1 Tax=unclassified Streptomyces TaxID=2593676 RepID=UPI00371B92F0
MTRIARWATVAAAAVASLGAFVAPAQAAGSGHLPPTEVRTAGCLGSTGHDAADRMVIDADSAAAFYRCHPSNGGTADRQERTTCAPGTLFDWSAGACRSARAVPEMGTRLTAGDAELSAKPPAEVTVRDLHATLRRADARGPQGAIGNATVTFTDGAGKVLCVARTDTAGRASCDAERPLSAVGTVLGGYTAEYAGNGSVNGKFATVAPATARGGVR